MTNNKLSYHKGDSNAGGGGSKGGAGKRNRPASGFEKGDVARGLADIHGDDIPVKPGRQVPHAVAAQAPTSSTDRVPAGPTIYDLLKAANAKLLTTLHKLEGEKREAERSELLGRLDKYYAQKRLIEDDYVFPLLLDHPEVSDAVVAARDEAAETQVLYARLQSTAPGDPNFQITLQALYGQIEQQVSLEDHQVLPQAARLVAVEDTVELAIQAQAAMP